MAGFTLECGNFKNGEVIPQKNTGEGKDVSPALYWKNIPAGARELVLICEDPDAPQPEPWVHWLIYHIPPTITEFPEGVHTSESLHTPAGVQQGLNSFGKIGYGGPMPPQGHGWHRYFFKLYALDTKLTLPPAATKDALIDEMRGHILGEAELMGKYQRDKAS